MGEIPRTPTPVIFERPVEPGWQRYRSLNPYQIDYPAEWKAESKGTQPETIKYFDIFFTTSNYTSVTIFSGKLAQPSAFNLMDYARNIETSYYNSDLYQRAFSELILPKTVAGNEIVMFSLHYVPKSSKPEFSQRESFQHIIMFIHNESLWQISLSYPFSVSINKAELKEINLKFAKMLESFKLLE